MSEVDHGAEARRWLEYAADDLRTAEFLLQQPDFIARHPCWLAQQAAEKALKALLIFLQIEYPFSHDLDQIRLLIPEGWRVRYDPPDLSFLTEWAVEARYPGDWPDATEVDAQEATDQARTVLEYVRGDLARHGLERGDVR
ncbi:MAG: HEPN domain-containing protein [Rhodothermales bacterium]